MHRNRNRQLGRDSDSEYTITQRPSMPFNHVTELNKQILNGSDTRALCEAETDQTDRQADRGNDRHKRALCLHFDAFCS
jgi:hypothetical protein